MGTAVLSSG